MVDHLSRIGPKAMSAFLAFLLAFAIAPALSLLQHEDAYAATTLSAPPNAVVEYSYSAGVKCGTIRYVSQIQSSGYFYNDYWGSYWLSQQAIADHPNIYYGPGYECGTCSISMALSYVGINKTPKAILDAGDGTTYPGGNWGATYKALSPSTISTGMSNYINGNGKYSPVVVAWPAGSSYYPNGHFVVLAGKISSTSYLVIDPASDSTWTISTSSDKYAAIKTAFQYYNSNATIHTHSYTTTYSYKSYNTHTVTKKCTCGTTTSTEACTFTDSNSKRVCSKCGKVGQPYGGNTVVTNIPAGEYFIVPAGSSSLAVSLEDGATASGTNICLEKLTEAETQEFDIIANENGTYNFASWTGSAGTMISVKDWSCNSSANIESYYYYREHMNKQWFIEKTSDGYYSFRNYYSNLYIDLCDGAPYVAGQNVWQYTGNGCFGPYDNITRGQVAVILFRAECAKDPGLIEEFGSTTDPSKYASEREFEDELAGVYYTAAVNWAKDAGIMTGDAGANYITVRPDDPVARQELCLMLARYANGGTVPSTELDPVKAQGIKGMNKIADWARDGVYWAVNNGVIGGVSNGDGTFSMDPTGKTWRSAAAKMFTVVMRDVL